MSEHNGLVTPEEPAGTSRRAFLTGAGAVAVAGITVTACSSDEDAGGFVADGDGHWVDGGDAKPTEMAEAPIAAAASAVPFAGERQVGLLLAPSPAGLVAAFDVTTDDRAELVATMKTLSAEIQRLMAGDPRMQGDAYVPPIDSGAIGPESTTRGVSITVAVGASLFDGRFGLADRRPTELTAMPRFFNDRLVQDAISHGDLSLTINAPNQQAAVFALHQVVRVTDRRLRLRWVQEGYNQLLPEAPGQIAETRNLMGFRDGTSNLDTDDQALMDRFVWVQGDDDEPDWAVGGTYQATRIIRMLIEFWATAALVRQEQIFGRHRESGAPMGQLAEGDEPAFASDPADETIPRRAHMRLANPRTPGTGRILRRGFSYLNGAAADGTLDQGLVFSCYQRSLRTGFLEVQSRLDGEPLEDYIKPVGGGLFFVLPGPGDGWLGQGLLA